MLKAITVAGLLVGLVHGYSAFAAQASDFPLQIQKGLDLAIRQSRMQTLKKAYEQFERDRRSSDALPTKLKKFGMDPKDIVWIKNHYTLPQGAVLPMPTLNETTGTITIEGGGNVLTIDLHYFEDGSFFVNGQAFKWDGTVITAENVRRYEGLFKDSKHTSEWKMPEIVAPAHAEESLHFSEHSLLVRAAGMDIYFTVALLGSPQVEAAALDTKVTKALKSCRNGEGVSAASGGVVVVTDSEDPWDPAGVVVRGAPIPDGQTYFAHDCRELKQLAGKYDHFVAVFGGQKVKRVPIDGLIDPICQKLNQLAVCVASRKDPASVSGGKLKKPSEDSDDWQDPAIIKKQTAPAK
ncbi:MAG: hypothetical protein ACXWP5_00780 [Bdellovibrionota bacterium]